MKEIKEQLKATIKECAKKAEKTVHSGEALHYTQAALNAVNALAGLK